MKEDNRMHIWRILIVIILIIILCIGGIFAYKEFTASKNKEVKEPTEETDSRKDLSTNDATVKELLSIFSIAKNHLNAGTNYLNNTAKLKLAMMQNGNSNMKTIPCSKVGGYISGNGQYSYCSDYKGDDFYTAEKQGPEVAKEFVEKNQSTKSLSSSILKAKVEELFGSDYTYIPEDFSATLGHQPTYGCQIWHYDKANDVYAFYGGLCGGEGTNYKEEVISAYKENKHLYIDTKIVEASNSNAELPVGTNISYEFKKDVKNNNYVFVKVKTVKEAMN